MMRRLGWILTPWAFCLGCSLSDNGGRTLFDNGARTLVVEPVQYCSHEDGIRTHIHHEKLADEAWGQFCSCNPGHEFSTDFARGFSDGFADYLDAGGTGEPPPLPPRRYWDQRDCRQASLDWFAGFRTGAGMAQRTGFRQCVVVPTGTQVCGSRMVPVYVAQCPQGQTPPVENVPSPIPLPPTIPSPSTTPNPGPATNSPMAPMPANLPLPKDPAGNSHESR